MKDSKTVVFTSYKPKTETFVIEDFKVKDLDDKKENPNCFARFFQNMATTLLRPFGTTKILVHILVCVFAIASWADLNGMWSELPLLVMKAKEGWMLPSYITIICQIANIGPILFVLVSFLAPHLKPRIEKVTSFVVIIISMVASFLLAFFWDQSSVVGGSEHSLALLTLNFFLALGDCTSSVSFYAFMSLMKPEYMASLFIGEGLSGMLPALIALGQGAGDIICYNKTVYNVYPMYVEANFSVKVFFLILAGIIAASAVSFLLLNFWGYCKSEMVEQLPDDMEKVIPSTGDKGNSNSYGAIDDLDGMRRFDKNSTNGHLNGHTVDNGHDGPYLYENGDTHSGASKNNYEEKEKASVIVTSKGKENHCRLLPPTDIPTWMFFLLLSLVVVINMTLTSFLPTIQIYTVLPYGLEYYHLATTLSQIANPVACFVALFLMAEKIIVIIWLTVLGQVCVGYLTYVAATSPEPPLHGHEEGGELAVALWIVVTLLLIYAKVCIAGILRKHGRTALIWAGVATQFGALIGAIVGFLLVNEYHLFLDAPYC
ncbi:unnamed protein product [Lymnaea stagnalis]|uniref:Riboflavin transporter n=1 Tax=Lymnaea stagnalis TaxID=6523 RepID=A0AAV2IRH8_LYMST